LIEELIAAVKLKSGVFSPSLKNLKLAHTAAGTVLTGFS
jgi:hypothetical protein